MNMTKPKVPKLKYDADWEAHARKLGTLPTISSSDWKAILAQRQFRKGAERDAKHAVTWAIFAFMRMNSGYNNLDDYRAKLVDLLEKVTVAYDQTYALDKYNHQRLLAIGPILYVDNSYEPMILQDRPMKDFCQTARALTASIRDLISAMGKRRPGPATDDIFWLVRALN